MKTRLFAVRVTRSMIRRVARLARVQSRNKSEIVRAALNEFADQRERELGLAPINGKSRPQ